jgi:hypothetical protein
MPASLTRKKKIDLDLRKTIKICQKRYCQKMVENASQISKSQRSLMLKDISEKIKELEKKPNKSKEELKIWKERKKMGEFFKKLNAKPAIMKSQKINMKTCTESHCNPQCKGTIFESKKISTNLTRKYKTNPKYLAFLQKQNDKIFQNKQTVLENDFYEKYTPKQIKEIQKEGAISGCSFPGALYFYKKS